jgi:fibronectin type 3 domain-containing protein
VRALAFSLIVSASFLSARAAPAEAPELKYFVEVRVQDLEDAGTLAAAGFDVAGIDRKTQLVGIVATPDELTYLRSFGWPVTIRSSNADSHAVDALSDYTDPQEMAAFMDSVVAAYPSLARKIALMAPLFEGQTQYALEITKDVTQPNDRPAFILDAQHHAREVMTPEIARDMIDWLTSRYATDPQVQRWVDNVNIYVVGSVNPDGAMYVFTADTLWRKNRHPSCPVDPNRNYPALWGSCNGSSSSCTAETTRGASGGSEPEVQGLMQLTASVHPFFTLSYHSYGEYLLYPYGCNDPDEKPAFDEVAQNLNAILPNDNGVTGLYATGATWSTIYLADGTSIDTQYNKYGAYAYCIEVTSSQFQPDYATWRDITVQRQRVAWQYFLDQTLDGAQIRGTVTDIVTGLPIQANVGLQEVTFTHGETPRTADANGRYRLLVHTNGTYHPVISASGYCTAIPAVAVGTVPAVVDVQLGKPGIPTFVAASAAGDNAIDLSWHAAANAESYRIYRSLTSFGPYTLVGTVPAPQLAYHDAPVSGGIPYYYVIRAVQGCESGSSVQVTATTTGACSVGPSFAGLASVANAATSTCGLTLSWPQAAARCGGALTYQVYRSTSASFTPSPATLVASGLSGTSFTDHDTLANGTTYNYIVRAADAVSGVDDGNSVARAAAPTGPDAPGTWLDDAGDAQMAKLTGTLPWSIKPTGGNAGPKVYATGTYSNNVCAALTTPAITLQSGAVLTFAAKYDLETGFDAGIVELAQGPTYTTWTKIPFAYPDPLPNSGNACGFPISGTATVFSRTNAAPTYPVANYSSSLSAYAGKSIKLRWRLSSDGGVVGAGFWVDDISVTNAFAPSVCSAGPAPAPKEPTALLASRASGSSVDATYAPACGALDDVAYWGVGPIAGSVAWTGASCGLGTTGHAVFDPGDPAPGTFLYFVIVGQRGGVEGSYGTSSASERPEAIGIGACDAPQTLGGSCP